MDIRDTTESLQPLRIKRKQRSLVLMEHLLFEGCSSCNAPETFQRCMMEIFSDMVEISIEVFGMGYVAGHVVVM